MTIERTKIDPKLVTKTGLEGTNCNFLNLMGGDTAFGQVLREALKNAFEAGAKNVFFFYDVVYKALTEAAGKAIYRQTIEDDACGMTGPELRAYMINLASSGKKLGKHDNHGNGLKFASLANNPEGVQIISYQNGEGSMVKMVQDEDGDYGLFNFCEENPNYREWVPVPDDYDAAYHRDHGTIVILCGKNPEDSTWLCGTKHQWASFYLWNRFWNVPEDVSVKVRFLHSNITGEKRTDDLVGARRYLEGEKPEAMGTMYLPKNKAKLHWMLFSKAYVDKLNASGKTPYREAYKVVPGFIAIDYQDELFNKTDKKRHARMVQFGIYIASIQDRLVLVVEPEFTETTGIYPNPTRSGLNFRSQNGMDQEDLPFAEWGKEFCDNMPIEIRKALKEEAVPLDTAKVMDKILNFAKDLVATLEAGSRIGMFAGGKNTRGEKKNESPDRDKSPPKTRRLQPIPKLVIDRSDNPEWPAKFAQNCPDSEDKTAIYDILTLLPKHDRFTSVMDFVSKAFDLQDDDGRRDIISEATIAVLGKSLIETVIMARLACNKENVYKDGKNAEVLLGSISLDMTLMGSKAFKEDVRRDISAAIGKAPTLTK